MFNLKQGQNRTILEPFTRPYLMMSKGAGASCNMRCDYCYYLEKEEMVAGEGHAQVSKMSDKVLEAFVQSYIASQPYNAPVSFTWHGGEALLRPRSFYEKALALQRKYAGGRRIENSLQTNGVLLNADWCRFFRDHNILVGISLDGTEEQHNKYRRTLSGGDSFALVMRGIGLLQQHGVDFNILSTVNSYNVDSPLEYYRFLKSIGAEYIQFTPIVERYAMGQKAYSHVQAPYIHARKDLRDMCHSVGTRLAPHSVRPEAWGDFTTSIFREWVLSDVGRIFVQLFDSTLARWMGLPPGVCTMAEICGHAGVIEHNGDVFSCDHFVYPRYKLGNVLETDLALMMHSQEQVRFGNAKREGLTEQCRSCLYLFACNGECPKNRFVKSRDGELGQNYLCKGYYKFFDFVAPYMDYMKDCLTQELPPSLVMRAIEQGILPNPQTQ